MARNILFYFTGTGNSLAVAKSIANKLEDTILMPILNPDALSVINQQTERIGLVFPIHINSVPRLVVKFIERMKNLPHIYYFAIATHGGRPGMTELYLNKIIKKQRITLDAYFEIKMINNTPKGIAPKFLMTMNWEEDITETHVNKMIEDTQIVLEKINRKIHNKEQQTIQYPPNGIKKLSYLGMNILWYINKKSKPKLAFVLDENQCNGCGTCAHVCTTKRIKINNNMPIWIHNDCSFCYACFNFCPTQAIGVEYYTKRLGRYHHPSISADEIAQQTNVNELSGKKY